jgi:hypothetical protein
MNLLDAALFALALGFAPLVLLLPAYAYLWLKGRK